MIIKSIIKCVLVVSWDSKTLIEQQQQQLAESVHLSVLLVISLTTSASYVVTLFTCQIYECAPAAANAVASCDTALMFRRRSRTPHAMTTSAASVANRLSPYQFHCTQAADIASDPITHICLFFLPRDAVQARYLLRQFCLSVCDPSAIYDDRKPFVNFYCGMRAKCSV